MMGDKETPENWEQVIFNAVYKVGQAVNDIAAYKNAVIYLKSLLVTRMSKKKLGEWEDEPDWRKKFEMLIHAIDTSGYLPPEKVEGIIDAKTVELLWATPPE